MIRNVCRGKILFIDDLVTYESATPATLREEFEAAVDDYLETCASLGKEPLRPFRGQFNVRVTPEAHRAATLRAVADGVSLNDVVVRALDTFLYARNEVNYNICATLETPDGAPVKTFTAVASGTQKWDMTNVH